MIQRPRGLPAPFWPINRPAAERAYESVAQTRARRMAVQQLALRKRARDDLLTFCQLRRPDYTFADWQVDLIKHLQWAVNTPNARLMIFAPPRHGKSEIVSRQLPAFLLGRNPREEILCASGTQQLADEFGLYVRNSLNDPIYREIFPGAAIDKNSNAVSRVTLEKGGGYRSVGCGALIVGRGGHWLIVDDPYASRVDAYSATTRGTISGWWRTEARTRLAPGGRAILMHQRWHPEDLAAELLQIQKEDPNADQWRVLVYPAIRELGYDDELDWMREPAQELDPRRWSMKSLRALQAGMDEAEWLALYQQRPVNAEGGFFKADWFQYHSGIPKNVNWYIGADFAATDDTRNDRCAFFPVAVSDTNDWYIPGDYVFEHLTSLEAVRKLMDLVKKYRPLYIATEKGPLDRVMRPILNQEMRNRGMFVSFREIVRGAGKHIVAAPLQARLQSRSVYLPNDRQTTEKIIPQFLDFIPEADNKVDDAIDALANLAQTMDALSAPAPELPELPEDEDALEEARWEKILAGARGHQSKSVPFKRFDGRPVT